MQVTTGCIHGVLVVTMAMAKKWRVGAFLCRNRVGVPHAAHGARWGTDAAPLHSTPQAVPFPPNGVARGFRLQRL